MSAATTKRMKARRLEVVQCSAWEGRVLRVMREELRRAMRAKQQLTVVIDPFVAGGGATIVAYVNTGGRSYDLYHDTKFHLRPQPKGAVIR